MKLHTVDINVDVGEGVGNEAQLMPFMSSCNIACGGHVGNTQTMDRVVALAVQHQVKIGGHPSFPDVLHFGRKVMQMEPEALYDSLSYQIDSLLRVLNRKGQTLHHVKPHGALYNLAVTDVETAQVIVRVMQHLDAQVKLYVPYDSVIEKIAIKNNVPIIYEAFADRMYNENLSLVSRSHPKAVIQDTDLVCQQVYQIAVDGCVKTITGKIVPIKAETFCLHGDHPKAETLISGLCAGLKQQGIKIV